MSRLIDRLLDKKPDMNWRVEDPEINLSNCPVIVVDDVERQLQEQYGNDNHEFKKEGLVISPPYPVFWMECKAWRREHGMWPRGWGCEFIALRRGEDDFEHELRRVISNHRIPATVEWVIIMLPIIEHYEGTINPMGVISTDLLDSQGHSVLGNKLFMASLNDRYREYDLIVKKHGREIADTAVYTVLQAFIMGLALLNAKNIVLEDVLPPPKLSKKHEKRKGRPLAKYKVLRVQKKTVRGYQDDPDNPNASGSTLPLHMVRGHMRDYTKGKGLFGRYPGIYFFADHVRGDIQNGIVFKEYDVKSSKQDD